MGDPMGRDGKGQEGFLLAGKDPMALGRLEGETPEWDHLARDLRAQGDPQPRGLTGWSLLLVVVAGTGSPTPDLTAELLYQLWVLLLHLLSELLAPAGGGRGHAWVQPGPRHPPSHLSPPDMPLEGRGTTLWRMRPHRAPRDPGPCPTREPCLAGPLTPG